MNQNNHIEVKATIQPEKKVKVRTKSDTQKKALEAHVIARQAYWAEKRPKWKSEPVARIESPLKFIGEKAIRREQNAKGEWVQRMEPFFYKALDLARAGKGTALQSMALQQYYA